MSKIMKKPYVIAEIGVNYYDTAISEKITPLAAAKKYISEAKKAGCDAVKFQSYKADTLASKNSPAYWDISKEPTKTQYELFQNLILLEKKNIDNYMSIPKILALILCPLLLTMNQQIILKKW